IGRNLTLPILNNVLLTTEDGRLRISSTNLEIGVNTWTAGKVEKSGAITCPAKVLTNFINNLPNKKVELEVKNNTLIIKCENYKAILNCLSADDFPIIPEIKDQTLIKLKDNELKDALIKVVGAASLSESRPEITGVLFKFNKQELRLAATDSFRLAEKVISDPKRKSEEIKSLIVPQRTIQEVIRVLGEKNSETKICLGEGQILFDSGETQVISRLIDGQYPDYQQIIPKEFPSQAIMEKADLLSVIRAAAVFSNKTNSIKFFLKEGELEVLAQDTDLGENKSQIKAQTKGKKIEVDFNYRYLLDGLANIDTKQVFLGMISDSNPAILKPVGDELYIYLVMPIKAN
ncbi:DNA polymerase III subunit beta, partial [Patescibacteria group bacterium]|nr:DNA polymerase III subunit beta [Patescibacteria group bacterium]